MLRKLRPRRPSHATVVAYLGLFVALGGTAYAVNTVGSADIIDGQVKSVDIGNNEIGSSDVKDNSLNTFDVHSFLGVDVVDGSLTGADIQDNTIGVNDIGSQQVASDEVANDSLLQSDIRAGAVTGDEVLDNSLTGTDINESSLNLATPPWTLVGSGGSGFFLGGDGSCDWVSYDSIHNFPGFVRDSIGWVHLKGLLRLAVHGGPGPGCVESNISALRRILTLPAGFRPSNREIHAVLTNGALGRLNVEGPAAGGLEAGAVYMEAPSTVANAKEWLSLDGISFRCAPSGQDGCP